MKISFCTTCMGRLDHLQQTLPWNLMSHQDNDVEFVVLNYNSQDNLDHWMKHSMSLHIETGILNYYTTTEPECFRPAHAKNIAHKVAQGDILVNLDADNFLIDTYVRWLRNMFTEREDIIVVSPSFDRQGIAGACGKIAAKKEHFYSVNGYDESMDQGWGADDTNFQFRCRMHNRLVMKECKKIHCMVLDHSSDRRVENFKMKNIEESSALSWKRLHEIAEREEYIANQDQHWGKATLLKNFSEKISI